MATNQPELIILIGFMGSGKSTMGKKLAKALGYSFYDVDQMLEEKFSLPISDYFVQFGEESFRLQEREMVHSLKHFSNAVISTGGGTPCFFNNMDVLNTLGITVYLKLHPKALQTRFNQENITKRPLLHGLSEEERLGFIESKLNEREVYYKKAKLTIDQIRTSPKELMNLIQQYKNQKL